MFASGVLDVYAGGGGFGALGGCVPGSNGLCVGGFPAGRWILKIFLNYMFSEQDNFSKKQEM